MLTEKMMYKALLEKDPGSEGIFLAAVKTTGIFCRPTCRARKPKIENVEFFRTAKEAIQKGYRPCKICKPLEKPGETPGYIRDILDRLNSDPSLALKDGDLVRMGIDPGRIRRWFLKNHGMTFHSFKRMFRLNSAFRMIQEGESVTSAAFESGYGSLSGFGEGFKTVFGVSPVNSREKRLISLSRIETPLGTMFAGGVREGICLLEFTDRRMLETELKHLSARLNASIVQGPNEHFEILQLQLNEYFEGRRRTFSIPLYHPGTAFQVSVWNGLKKIPYGETVSYKQQAMSLNYPGSVRAVANANGMNRLAILVPCHRVIGSGGELTGYGGGIWRKKWLLDHEKAILRAGSSISNVQDSFRTDPRPS